MKPRVPIELIITHDFDDIGGDSIITPVSDGIVSYTWHVYICKVCGIIAAADNSEYINSMPLYTCAEYIMKQVL